MEQRTWKHEGRYMNTQQEGAMSAAAQVVQWRIMFDVLLR